MADRFGGQKMQQVMPAAQTVKEPDVNRVLFQ